ncbi:MAG: hypothetical protein ABI668_09925 [Sphingorhabdus sp.]
MTRSTSFSPLFWHLEVVDLFTQAASMWFTTSETVTASARVVGARMPIIEAAILDPLSADLPEISMMASEKMVAFSQAQRAYWSAFGSLTQMVQAHYLDIMGMTLKARPVGLQEIYRLNDRSKTIVQVAAGAGEKVLKPYHRKVTANAKRLRGK